MWTIASRFESCLSSGIFSIFKVYCVFKQNSRVVLRHDLNDVQQRGCVSIVCGGGSGHEPYTAGKSIVDFLSIVHVGLVGRNGVSAAISGDVYASPPTSHVLDAITATYTNNGVLVFCNNYTGDRLNFGIAVEKFKAKSEGDVKIGLVYVDDDVSLEGHLNTAGRRGLAGGMLVMHMVCVMSESKQHPFETIDEQSQKMIHNTGTYGISLYPCALPGRDYLFKMPEDELEFGLGQFVYMWHINSCI